MSHALMEQPGTARTVVPTGQARSFEPIVDQFLQRIHDGQLRPGERLDTERELAAQFGVSRGVIREAIKVLVALGLVESRQGSGTYISNHQVPSISRSLILSARPEPDSLAEMAEYRIPLERQGAELAAQAHRVAHRPPRAPGGDEAPCSRQGLQWNGHG